MYIYITSVWLHIIAVSIWLGSMFFLVLILMPILRQLPITEQPRLFQKVALRLRTISWTSLAILVITGGFLIVYRFGNSIFQYSFWSYSHTLLVKIALAMVVIILSAIHDFAIGPRTVDKWIESPNTEEVKKLRKQSAILGQIIFLLSLIIVFLGVKFVRGG